MTFLYFMKLYPIKVPACNECFSRRYDSYYSSFVSECVSHLLKFRHLHWRCFNHSVSTTDKWWTYDTDQDSIEIVWPLHLVYCSACFVIFTIFFLLFILLWCLKIWGCAGWLRRFYNFCFCFGSDKNSRKEHWKVGTFFWLYFYALLIGW